MEGAASNRVSYQWPGRGPPLVPYFETKLRPKGPSFFLDRVPPPLSQGLDDWTPPS